VDGAALPGRAEHLADRVLQSFVRVGDDQRHAGQATLDHASEEVAPERLGLALAAVEADHLAPTRLVHAVRDHHALPHDAAAVADLLHLGVEPDVAGAALERPAAERVDLLIKASADARDLALGDPQPERLDQLVNLSRRDAAHVRLLDHADQCLLAAAARLEERRNVRAAPDLRNRQLDLAGACVPSGAAGSRCDASTAPGCARRARRRSPPTPQPPSTAARPTSATRAESRSPSPPSSR
jgi:hypothetical protein